MSIFTVLPAFFRISTWKWILVVLLSSERTAPGWKLNNRLESNRLTKKSTTDMPSKSLNTFGGHSIAFHPSRNIIFLFPCQRMDWSRRSFCCQDCPARCGGHRRGGQYEAFLINRYQPDYSMNEPLRWDCNIFWFLLHLFPKNKFLQAFPSRLNPG